MVFSLVGESRTRYRSLSIRGHSFKQCGNIFSLRKLSLELSFSKSNGNRLFYGFKAESDRFLRIHQVKEH